MKSYTRIPKTFMIMCQKNAPVLDTRLLPSFLQEASDLSSSELPQQLLEVPSFVYACVQALPVLYGELLQRALLRVILDEVPPALLV